MTTPITPRHKRLAITDSKGNRATSTPPDNRPRSLAVPILSPSSRHSSPGLDRYQPRIYADELIPRRLTASPIARIKSTPIRRRLTQYHSIDHAVHLLSTSKNIVVLSGAGISTSLDIPDFRSDGGFYSRLSSKIGITTPEEFFSLDWFTHNHEAFWDNVKPLLPRHIRTKTGSCESLISSKQTKSLAKSSHSSKPTKDPPETVRPRFSSTHALLALLDSRSQLLTNYTQNIDGLESVAGVTERRVIQCHGSWSTATCLTCSKTIRAKSYLPIVYEQGYPRCSCSKAQLSKATTKPANSAKRKRKRAIYEGDSDHSSDDGTSIPKGLYKPDITFFGEGIPGTVDERLAQDKPKADLLVIMGTSLKVRPVKGMLMDFANVPQIWINRERYSGIACDMPGVNVDIELLGECDLVVEELCRRAGMNLDEFLWKEDGEKIVKVNQKNRKVDGTENEIAKGDAKGVIEKTNGSLTVDPQIAQRPKQDPRKTDGSESIISRTSGARAQPDNRLNDLQAGTTPPNTQTSIESSISDIKDFQDLSTADRPSMIVQQHSSQTDPHDSIQAYSSHSQNTANQSTHEPRPQPSIHESQLQPSTTSTTINGPQLVNLTTRSSSSDLLKSSHPESIKITISDSITRKLSDQESSHPVQDVRVISDLDAEWRWRISKRPGTASSIAGSQASQVG